MGDDLRELLEALNEGCPPHTAYRLLQETLHRAADRAFCNSRVVFAGLFAKIEHLAKAYDVPRKLLNALHTTRGRMHRAAHLTQEELTRFFPHDLHTVCDFLALLPGAEPVPEGLRARFAPDYATNTACRDEADYLRAAVKTATEEEIIACEEESGEEICVDYGGTLGDIRFDYLKRLLREGSQINIIRPQRTDGKLHAQLIVLEPDYLIDISAIAACFTEYADSAYLSLLAKIQPAPTGKAILLGNFAGRLLDEAARGSKRSYAESLTDFFRENAIDMAAAEDLEGFHEEARRQRDHIRRAMEEDLPEAVADFKRELLILEPSFFCEMLGLQGRMDFLQTDYRVLIEQKSGSARYMGRGNDTLPHARENHYAQLLLYRALLHYAHHVRQKDISAFLLYSRYEQSLLRLGSAPCLLAEAFRIRNQMVWCELSYADGGFRLLDRLTPEALRQKQVNERFWQQYVRPRIDAPLRRLREAGAVERAYFYRFMAFVAAEHRAAKFGTPGREASGFAALWHDTIDERRAAGAVYDELTLLQPLEEEGAVCELTLRFSETTEVRAANFRRGDAVVLYDYAPGEPPDVRRGIVFRAAIARITANDITLRLRDRQSDARVFRREAACRWAVEHDFMESGATTLYRGLAAMLGAPKRRRDLLLAQRRPEVDKSIALRGEYGDFSTLVQRARQARDLFLIIGPPGTGKTSHGMLNLVREELADPDGSVLLLSFTHRAVDEICATLDGAGIDFLRLGSSLSCDERFVPHLLEERVRHCPSAAAVREMVKQARVVCATTATLSARPTLLALRSFSLAIVDEASQILEPHICAPLAATCDGSESIARIVMIGDHKQLPAVVAQSEALSRVDEPELQRIGLTDCRLSLFERFIRLYGNDPDLAFMLRRQGRMHRDIADFPSRFFYGNLLQPVPLPHQTAPLTPPVPHNASPADFYEARRVCFIPAPLPRRDGADKANEAEAEIVAEIAAHVMRRATHFDPARTLGIIVPYRGQIAAIRAELARRCGTAAEDVNIDTVERYQGSQRDVIIYGFTVSRPYQLDFLTSTTFEENGTLIDRKLNVVMTRAREHLVMVGHTPLLRRAPVFDRLLDYLERQGAVFSDARA